MASIATAAEPNLVPLRRSVARRGARSEEDT